MWMNQPPFSILLAMLLTATSVPSSAHADEGACFSDWSSASAAVRENGLVTAEELTRLAPKHLGGDLVRLSLCELNSEYTYRLIVRTTTGLLKTYVVDAKQPFNR
jgi:hypothetical protein